MWTAQSQVNFQFEELTQRFSQHTQYAQTCEVFMTGEVAVGPEDFVDLLGHLGGLFDDVFESLSFIALFPLGGRFHIFASNAGSASDPIVITVDGCYFTPHCTANHLVVGNPSDTDTIRVRYYLGGDAA